MSHNAAAVRDRNARWALWSSACPCGWTSAALGREDAQQRAVDHNRIETAREVAESMRCDCGQDYDPETLEWAPEQKPCPKHRLEEALGLERAS